jgi:hypothetical protein
MSKQRCSTLSYYSGCDMHKLFSVYEEFSDEGDRLNEHLEKFKEMGDWDEVYPISAKTGENVDELIDRILDYLPGGAAISPTTTSPIAPSPSVVRRSSGRN